MLINKEINITCAHICLMAIQKIFPSILLSNIDINETGFYVDLFYNEKISSNDFKSIEKEMKKIIASGSPINIVDNLNNLNKYQQHYIKENNDLIYIKIGNNYSNISSKEICNNVNKVKFYELTNISGIYWLNNIKNEQLIRIYGSAFNNEKDFSEWKEFLINQKESDHRKIGQDMEIFTFDNMIGQGLPIWMPNGEIIKNEIKKFLFNIFGEENFMFLDTPILGSKELYQTSGHWDHYKENNFPPITIDNETFILRPMTCPHHMIVYKQKPHSYKELPVYYCENSKLHRYESSGSLIGLERVRAMELFDSHVICKPNEIESVIKKLDSILKEVHKKMSIKIDQIDLSLHDEANKEKYHYDPEMWNKAEGQLRNILKELKYNFHEMKGEAAFYGPKIDYQAKSNLGKLITISTIQLDFLLPKRFELEYIDETNQKQTPVLIHFGVIGTYERFIATMLSQKKGILPFWMMPSQVVIIPVNNSLHLNYAKEIFNILKENNIRCSLDDSDERMSKKIRIAQTSKIPYQIIIGDNECNNKTISFRKYGEQNTSESSIENFINEISNRNYA